MTFPSSCRARPLGEWSPAVPSACNRPPNLPSWPARLSRAPVVARVAAWIREACSPSGWLAARRTWTTRSAAADPKVVSWAMAPRASRANRVALTYPAALSAMAARKARGEAGSLAAAPRAVPASTRTRCARTAASTVDAGSAVATAALPALMAFETAWAMIGA
uniref:Uncharacterized protein n=1 Tax=Human herpesvirus 1 TaxID=10298 RepID=A0A2Z4H555_HHV1|nr:hypothetical protein [Human alphaherpesvirus 1]AWW09856.1 hypothetical protein [Human alphaherpesvirus 1]